ncbi:MAG: FecR domain-containing protein [Pseudomonadota bacterium]
MQAETDSTASISEQAAAWWVVFHDEAATAADHREFGQWVAKGPDRVAAYLRMARVQRALQSPAVRWPQVSRAALISEAIAAPEDVVPLRPAVAARSASPERARSSTAFPPIALRLAASVLLVLGVVWLMAGRPDKFQTVIGEQKIVLLEDGSKVTLNSASAIEVQLAKQRRHVLLVRGEALFEVAHDPARPFEVETGDVVLRAVGTQFDVNRQPRQTVVTMVEGKVALVSVAGQPQQEDSRPVLVAADRMIISAAGAQEHRHGVDVSAAIAWTRGRLVFKNRALGEVAEEFNRYNQGRIEIRSAELRAREITGAFRSNDPESFTSFLSGMPGVRVADDGRGGYLVTLDAEVR